MARTTDTDVPAGVPPRSARSVERRLRQMRRRYRTASLRQWVGAISVGGAALAIMTMTLFSLIAR